MAFPRGGERTAPIASSFWPNVTLKPGENRVRKRARPVTSQGDKRRLHLVSEIEKPEWSELGTDPKFKLRPGTGRTLLFQS